MDVLYLNWLFTEYFEMFSLDTLIFLECLYQIKRPVSNMSALFNHLNIFKYDFPSLLTNKSRASLNNYSSLKVSV